MKKYMLPRNTSLFIISTALLFPGSFFATSISSSNYHDYDLYWSKSKDVVRTNLKSDKYTIDGVKIDVYLKTYKNGKITVKGNVSNQNKNKNKRVRCIFQFIDSGIIRGSVNQIFDLKIYEEKEIDLMAKFRKEITAEISHIRISQQHLPIGKIDVLKMQAYTMDEIDFN